MHKIVISMQQLYLAKFQDASTAISCCLFVVIGVTMWSVDPRCRSGWVECRRRMNVAWSCLDLANPEARPGLVIAEADQEYHSVHDYGWI